MRELEEYFAELLEPLEILKKIGNQGVRKC